MTTVRTDKREVKEARRRRQIEKRVERSVLHDFKIYFEII